MERYAPCSIDEAWTHHQTKQAIASGQHRKIQSREHGDADGDNGANRHIRQSISDAAEERPGEISIYT